jgi:peptidoglycan/LPS O-acetylase OafA/YrhL
LVRNISLICLGLTFLLTPSEAFVCHYVFLFLLGIITYQYRKKLLAAKSFLCAVALLTVCLLVSLGPAITMAGLATALAIAFLNTSGGPFKFFGKISYSIYLMHASVGSAILDFSLHRVHGIAGRLSVYVIALGATILSAYLLYQLVELPAQRWSAGIAYQRKPERAGIPAMLDVESL